MWEFIRKADFKFHAQSSESHILSVMPAIWVWTDAPVDFHARNRLKNSALKPMLNMLVVCTCVYVISFLGFPGGSAGKESACNAGDLGSIPVLGRSSGEGKGYPYTQKRKATYSILAWPEECHRLYSPRDCKELDTTERFSLHYFILKIFTGV